MESMVTNSHFNCFISFEISHTNYALLLFLDFYVGLLKLDFQHLVYDSLESWERFRRVHISIHEGYHMIYVTLNWEQVWREKIVGPWDLSLWDYEIGRVVGLTVGLQFFQSVSLASWTYQSLGIQIDSDFQVAIKAPIFSNLVHYSLKKYFFNNFNFC